MGSLSRSDGASTDELVTLSLHKFSYATTLGLKGKLLWTHVTQSNNALYANVAQLTFRNEEELVVRRKKLKVFHGQTMIEDICLDDLVHQARDDESRLRSQFNTDTDRVVIAIIKRPMIAIRYQLHEGQIRRIQMNFSPESGYNVLLNILLGVGLPIREKLEQGSASLVPKASSSTNTSLPALTNHLQGHSALPNSSHNNNNNNQVLPSLPAQSSSQDLYKASHYTQGSAAWKAERSTAQSPFTSSTSIHPGYNELSTARQNPLPGIESRPWSHESYALNNAQSGHGVPLASVSSYHSPHALSLNPTPEDPVRRSLFPTVTGNDRPWTAPTTVDSLSQMLPPKRELPFAKSAMLKLSENIVINPKQNATDFQARRPETRPIASKGKAPKPKSASEHASRDMENLQGKTTRSKSKPTKTTGALKAFGDGKILSEEKAQGKTVFSGNVETSTSSTKPVEESKGTVERPIAGEEPFSYTSAATQTPSALDNSPSRLHASKFAEEWIGVIEDLASRSRDHTYLAPSSIPAPVIPAANKVFDLAEYATRPAAERRATLEAMIHEWLVDENFGIMSEDAEHVWKRIGLGM